VSHSAALRITHRLEQSGELVCKRRGSGHNLSEWEMPGVVRDGYADKKRGSKMPPQGWRIAIPEGSKRHPRGSELPPVTKDLPSTDPSTDQQHAAPPGNGASKAGESPLEVTGKDWESLHGWLKRHVPAMTEQGRKQLIDAVVALEPDVRPSEIADACVRRMRNANGVRNLPGLLIRVIPGEIRSQKLYR